MYICCGEMGDRAGDFQDAAVVSGREVDLLHRLVQRVAESRIAHGVLEDLRVGHERIRGNFPGGKTRVLQQPGRL